MQQAFILKNTAAFSCIPACSTTFCFCKSITGMLRRGLYVAGAAVCGFTAVRLRDKYSQKYLSNDTSSAVGVTDAVMLAMRRVVHAQKRLASCDANQYPTVCVVTEIPQGSAIYLTGHGDQDINQGETGADPFIFNFTRGYIPKTRISRDEPLSAMVLGHLESVPGLMLKDATVVGQLVVVQQDTGVPLSKDLVVVVKDSTLTREQIEDLMMEAASCLEILKSEFELGTKVFVQPMYDPTVAAKTLLEAKLEYGNQKDLAYKSDISKKPSKTMAQRRRESRQAKELLGEMPLSDVPLSNLFEELARRGISEDASGDSELRQAHAPDPR